MNLKRFLDLFSTTQICPLVKTVESQLDLLGQVPWCMFSHKNTSQSGSWFKDVPQLNRLKRYGFPIDLTPGKPTTFAAIPKYPLTSFTPSIFSRLQEASHAHKWVEPPAPAGSWWALESDTNAPSAFFYITCPVRKTKQDQQLPASCVQPAM